MAILSKACKPDSFESLNSLKLSFTNIRVIYVVLLSIVIETVFAWYLVINLLYWLQMWQHHFWKAQEATSKILALGHCPFNNYHQTIKLTIEISPTKFFQATSNCVDGVYNTRVHRKTTKLSIHWLSKVPKCYKSKTLFHDLLWAKEISSNFEVDVSNMIDKFWKGDWL